MKSPGLQLKPGLFTWTKIGRSWVAHIGKLSLVVVERGSQKSGLHWRVSDVFGNQHLGSGWRYGVRHAIREAEAIAVREALPALRKILAARARKAGS